MSPVCCPICNSMPEVYLSGHQIAPEMKDIWVATHSCNNSTIQAFGSTKEEATNNWNKRIKSMKPLNNISTAIEIHKLLNPLIEKKIKFKSALEFMRKKSMIRQVCDQYEWKFYSIAADCIEHELDRVDKEITDIEKS